MAAKARKRPPKPAEPAEGEPEQPPPAPAPPEPQVKVARPPQRAHQPVAQVVDPVVPRNPDDVIHNVMVRQLADDITNPPTDTTENPALQVLTKVMDARQEGRSLEQYKQELAQQITGGEELNKLVWHLYRRFRLYKMVNLMRADDDMDRFLLRCFHRGDFTPTEALVFKRLSQTTIKEMAEELLEELREGVGEVQPDEVLNKLDLSLKITESSGRELLAKTTPQGREIVRKLVFTARRRLYPNAK